MDVKKRALIGALALVVFSCILAAGCTSVPASEPDPMIGQWICTNSDVGNGIIMDMVAVFNADGSGECLLFKDDYLYQNETIVWYNRGNSTYQFDISAPSLGTYTGTYTLAANTTSMSDESGRIWHKLTDLQPLDKNDKIVGAWAKTSVKNGTKNEQVFIIHADGNGYWMRLADTPGISSTRMRHQDFSRTGETTVVGLCSAGRIYRMEYNPETDSIFLNGKSEFTRHDPVVGIWSETSTKGGDTVTTIMKSDGTGIAISAYANGTSQINRLTWEKNTDGIYAIAFSNGDTASYTLGVDRLSLTSDAGATKTKQFMDTYYLLPIPGAWYSNESSETVILNGDRTGTIRNDTAVLPVTWDYTWKETDNIDFTIQYPATQDSGSSAKPEVWKYNLTSDTIDSAQGITYTHPSASVEGRITFT